MNKMILGIFSFLLVALSVQAQQADVMAAKKAFTAYKVDPRASKEKLREALAAILPEPNGEDASDPGFFILRGDILNELANQIVVVKKTGLGSLEDYPQVEMVAVRGYSAYETALEKHVQAINSPGYLFRDVVKGIKESQRHLSDFGVYAFEAQDYGSAYLHSSSILASHVILRNAGAESLLDDANTMKNQKFLTGLAALNNNMTDVAKPLFEELYQANYDNPTIYEALYTVHANGEAANLDAAYHYLKTGREKYPEEASLLFAEINHFLKLNRLDELTDKLKMAINSEPDNLPLYITLGGVYDNLYQREFAAGNSDRARNYFDEAVNYYNQNLEKDPNNFDALYSIGSLYYNRAANMTIELTEMSDDFSRAGMEKYKAIEGEVFAAFDKALPYFQKAERLNPNDINILIALKEIYARNSQPETSNALEQRLENLRNGRVNETSFFNE